jgi:hypothetical protein
MYGQTGAGKTYTMLGDYSQEVAAAGNARASSQTRNKTPSRLNQSKMINKDKSSGTTNLNDISIQSTN